MVYSFQLTYDEITDFLDVKCIAGSTKGYILAPAIYEVTDINMMFESLLPKVVKLKITIDDKRLKSNLTTNKTISFTEKYCFNVSLGFTQSHSGELGDNEGFVQLIPSTFKSG